MTWKDYWNCQEEIFIGAVLQFPLYFIVGWSVVPIGIICGLLWRAGGAAGSSKLFRRLGVPILVCGATFLVLQRWTIFLAIPFMIWIAPSYGVDSWLYKLIKKWVPNDKEADFITRSLTYLWYWVMFSIALLIK